MSEKIIGTIYTKIRFEAMIREHKTGEIEMHDVFVQYTSGVIYEAGGEEKVDANGTMPDYDNWTAAIANTQPLTRYGETGELISLRKRETTIEKKMRTDTQLTIFDAIRDEEDALNTALRDEAAERYDQMIGR